MFSEACGPTFENKSLLLPFGQHLTELGDAKYPGQENVNA